MILYDVGFSKGVFSDKLLRIIGQNNIQKIIAIQANDDLVKQYDKRNKKVQLYNYAVSNKDNQIIKFYVDNYTPDGSWSTITPKTIWNQRFKCGCREIKKVQSITLDVLFKKHGVPEFLKLDIQGAQYLALCGLNKERLPEYITFQVSQQLFDDLIKSLITLNNLGYNKFHLQIPDYNDYSTIRKMLEKTLDYYDLNQTLQYIEKIKTDKVLYSKLNSKNLQSYGLWGMCYVEK